MQEFHNSRGCEKGSVIVRREEKKMLSAEYKRDIIRCQMAIDLSAFFRSKL